MLTLEEVKKHPGIKECIKKSAYYLNHLGFTDHGPRHINMVSDRAKSLAKNIGLSTREQELSAIAGYCHDMGNFLQRSEHCFAGAMLFSQFFSQDDNLSEVLEIVQAINDHDEGKHEIVSNIGAVLVLADKSDVHRSRVRDTSPQNIKKDIHDRVNYSVIDSSFRVNKLKKEIVLRLKIDLKITGVMEYFEIFNDRMIFCRKAATFLGYKFVLIINNFKLF
ncbi:MAG TPA: HD domain-containing protein [bacterium]|nr:HD domain-containing protein [bacterium]